MPLSTQKGACRPQLSVENEARETPIFFDPGSAQLLFVSEGVVAVSGLGW